MNQYPQHPQVVPVVATKTNVLGMVGFWLSAVGLISCGVTGVPGFVCSVLASREEPKGWAIAGIFIGVPSMLWCGFWVVTWTLAALTATAAGAVQ